MYIKKTWKAGKTIEVKKTYSARFGRKIQRSADIGHMGDAQKKVNKKRAVDELRRILNANFQSGDWHAIFTYPQTKEPTVEEAKRDREKLLRRARAAYKAAGVEMKTVKVTEYENHRIHHHIVMTDLGNSMREIKAIWRTIIAETYYTQEERDRGEPLHLVFPWSELDDSGQYGKLAEYLIKETEKTHAEEGAKRHRYSCSRNIIRPQPTVEIIYAREWREEPPARRGYYIDREISYNGYSDVTGMEVQETVYVLLDKKQKKRRRITGEKEL